MSGKHQIGGSGAGISKMKLVKPSELSLDPISPYNMRNVGIKGSHGIHNQTTLGGGPNTSTNNNSNMSNIL